MAKEQKILTEVQQNMMEIESILDKPKRVAYIFNDEYLQLCSKLPKVKNRVRFVKLVP